VTRNEAGWVLMRYLPKFLGISVSLLAAYSWWIEPCRLQITHHDIADPKQRFQSPIRVLLLTDWHLGRFSRPRTLRAKMEKLRTEHDAEPFDIILLGGDYVDGNPKYLPLLRPSLMVLAEFGAPLYAVLGNHDYTSFGGQGEPAAAFLEGAGVHVLQNTAAAVMVRGQRLLIIGLDDLQESKLYYDAETYQTPTEYKDAARRVEWYAKFDNVEPEAPRLVLSHNPDAVYLPGLNPLAVLCGHTHGGQIMLLDWVSRPLHRWIHPHLPPGSAVTWAGRRRVEGRTLLVSRGMEGSAVPVRFFRPPEAIVVVLH